MKLGVGTATDRGDTGDILTAAKWLDELPVGSVIRNGCDSKADPHADGKAVYFVKVPRVPGGFVWELSDYVWKWADPATYRPIGDASVVFRAVDVFLPVQVMRRGVKPIAEVSDVA